MTEEREEMLQDEAEAMAEAIREEVRELAREIARDEIASLAGLVLRRLQDISPGAIDRTEFASIFGEALRDYGATLDEPGA